MRKTKKHLKCKTKNNRKSPLMTVKDFAKLLAGGKFDLLGKINKLSKMQIGLFYLIIFILGRVLLLYNPIPFGLIHQVVLTIISFIVISSLKYAYKITSEINAAVKGEIFDDNKKGHATKTLSAFVDQMIEMQKSAWWLVIVLVPPIRFIRKNLYLGFIEKNPAGYYAIIFAATTYYLALLGYTQILIALVQFYKISNDKDDCIPLIVPRDLIEPPKWLLLWNALFQKILHRFFIVGTLFTFEYILLMPRNIISIDKNKFHCNARDTNAFLFSWGTIAVFIIVAFPLISFIINKMKKQAIKNFSKKINREYGTFLCGKVDTYSPLDLWACKQLIKDIGKYDDFLITTFSIIPVASTFISLLLNIIKLYESVLLPLLRI